MYKNKKPCGSALRVKVQLLHTKQVTFPQETKIVNLDF